jgi:hypothetical protein
MESEPVCVSFTAAGIAKRYVKFCIVWVYSSLQPTPIMQIVDLKQPRFCIQFYQPRYLVIYNMYTHAKKNRRYPHCAIHI